MQSYYIYFRIHLYLLYLSTFIIYFPLFKSHIIYVNRKNNKDTFQNKNNHAPVLQFLQQANMPK
jgi:hypothetical protein